MKLAFNLSLIMRFSSATDCKPNDSFRMFSNDHATAIQPGRLRKFADRFGLLVGSGFRRIVVFAGVAGGSDTAAAVGKNNQQAEGRRGLVVRPDGHHETARRAGVGRYYYRRFSVVSRPFGHGVLSAWKVGRTSGVVSVFAVQAMRGTANDLERRRAAVRPAGSGWRVARSAGHFFRITNGVAKRLLDDRRSETDFCGVVFVFKNRSVENTGRKVPTICDRIVGVLVLYRSQGVDDFSYQKGRLGPSPARPVVLVHRPLGQDAETRSGRGSSGVVGCASAIVVCCVAVGSVNFVADPISGFVRSSRRLANGGRPRSWPDVWASGLAAAPCRGDRPIRLPIGQGFGGRIARPFVGVDHGNVLRVDTRRGGLIVARSSDGLTKTKTMT